MRSRTLNIVAYVLDAFVLITYALVARDPAWILWFHVANAVGFLPLLVIEVRQKAYPVVPLTLTFGVVGAVGVINTL